MPLLSKLKRLGSRAKSAISKKAGTIKKVAIGAGLVGAGAVGAPLLINMLRGGTGTQRNTVSPTKSSSGLTVSNRWRFAKR